VSGHHLHRVHVNLIEIRTLFAIDFDVHKVVVHQLGDLFVLKRLVLHDMTPVTGGVPDAEQNRLRLSPRFGERLVAPRIPINGIVSVLKKVWTGFVD